MFDPVTGGSIIKPIVVLSLRDRIIHATSATFPTTRISSKISVSVNDGAWKVCCIICSFHLV